MLPQVIVKNSLKSRTPRSTAIHQDHNKRYTAPYARGVALCLPLARPASAPLARPALLKLARLAGKKKTTSSCGVRRASASRSAYAPRTARYTASYPRDAAGAPTRRPIGGAAPVALRLPQERGETNLLCGVRPAAASRLRRTTRYAASYCSRSSCRPQQRRATAPLARN